MNLNDLKPGRELDALVSEHVFGVHFVRSKIIVSSKGDNDRIGKIVYWDDQNNKDLPNYSTSIADAWLVVEKLYELTKGITFVYNGDSKEWWIQYTSLEYKIDSGLIVVAKTLPHGISLSALKAVGYGSNETLSGNG